MIVASLPQKAREKGVYHVTFADGLPFRPLQELIENSDIHLLMLHPISCIALMRGFLVISSYPKAPSSTPQQTCSKNSEIAAVTYTRDPLSKEDSSILFRNMCRYPLDVVCRNGNDWNK